MPENWRARAAPRQLKFIPLRSVCTDLRTRNDKDSNGMKYLNIKKALAAWQELQPLSEKDRERLSRRFTVDFNYNSNHIEGNTLTYGQTEILLLFGKVIGLCHRQMPHRYTRRTPSSRCRSGSPSAGFGACFAF